MAKRESQSIRRSALRAQSSAAPRAGPHAIDLGSFSAPDSRPLQRCLLRPPQGAPTDTPLSRAIATVRSNGKPHESNSRKATSAGSAVACRRSSAHSSVRSICARPASHRHDERTGRARSETTRGEARHGACCALASHSASHGKRSRCGMCRKRARAGPHLQATMQRREEELLLGTQGYLRCGHASQELGVRLGHRRAERGEQRVQERRVEAELGAEAHGTPHQPAQHIPASCSVRTVRVRAEYAW